MKDLILEDVDDLNLEYRCDAGFKHFFAFKISSSLCSIFKKNVLNSNSKKKKNNQ
jgi:hypothetical protein